MYADVCEDDDVDPDDDDDSECNYGKDAQVLIMITERVESTDSAPAPVSTQWTHSEHTVNTQWTHSEHSSEHTQNTVNHGSGAKLALNKKS